MPFPLLKQTHACYVVSHVKVTATTLVQHLFPSQAPRHSKATQALQTYITPQHTCNNAATPSQPQPHLAEANTMPGHDYVSLKGQYSEPAGKSAGMPAGQGTHARSYLLITPLNADSEQQWHSPTVPCEHSMLQRLGEPCGCQT